MRKYPEHRFELIDVKLHQEAILSLVKRWKNFETDGSQDAQSEEEAIELLLQNYEALSKDNDLYCVALFEFDKLIAFCFLRFWINTLSRISAKPILVTIKHMNF